MKVIQSGTQIIHTLPSGETFNIEHLQRWQELSPRQQGFVTHFIESAQQKTLSRVLSGVSEETLKSWEKESAFAEVLLQVDLLFTEGLQALDYIESLTNGKIRGRVLTARRAKGYEPKHTITQQNNLNLISGEGGLSGILKALKS